MKHMSYKAAKVIPRIIHFIIKNILRCTGVCENKKNNDRSRFFLVEGWSIEGHVTKVVEWIVMDFGLLTDST